MSSPSEGNRNIQVEITDAHDFHCFRLVLNPQATAEDPAPRIEVMLHARSLVDLIHKCSIALCDWQAQTTGYLIDRLTGNALDAARHALLSYQHGNSSPDLAEEIVAELDKLIARLPGGAS